MRAHFAHCKSMPPNTAILRCSAGLTCGGLYSCRQSRGTRSRCARLLLHWNW